MEEHLFESFVNRTRLCEAEFDEKKSWSKVCLLTEDKVLENIRIEVDKCVQESF